MNKDIKILFLINKFKRGGAEKAFANQINELHRRGYDVCLGLIYDFSPFNSYLEDLKLPSEKIINFCFRNLFDFRKLLLLKKFVIENNIGIIYSTLESANIVSRLLKIFLPCSNIKIIIRESGMADRKNRRNKMLDLLLNIFVDKIIAVSGEVKESLLKYQKINGKKIVVIENGVPIRDLDEIKKKRFELKKDNEDVFKIINIGLMGNGNKGQGEILNIFKEISNDQIIGKSSLTLIGDGILKKEYIDFAKKNNLGNRILFTGYIKTEELIDCYLTADLFILYSKNEGCPNAVLEAMSFGVPVISTLVGGISAIIEEGKSGFIVQRGDKDRVKKIIADLAKNKELRMRISGNAYQRIKDKYSIQIKTDELVNLFRQIL